MRRTTRKRVIKIVVTCIMLVGSIVMIMPFLWMISTSFKNESEIFNFPIEWIPKDPTLRNYRFVFLGKDDMAYGRQMVPFLVYYWNSIKITVITVVGSVAICSASAYAFAKINFFGKRLVFTLYISTLMFPSAVLLMPRFVLYRMVGLYNTQWALILPEVISVFGIFLMRQFYMSLPNELSEAAKIDGCNHYRIFLHITTPLIKPAITAYVVLSFVWKWNDYENALIFLNTPELYPLPLGIVTFRTEFSAAFGPVVTASLSSMIPLFIIFLAGQKYFVQGVALTGVKA